MLSELKTDGYGSHRKQCKIALRCLVECFTIDVQRSSRSASIYALLVKESNFKRIEFFCTIFEHIPMLSDKSSIGRKKNQIFSMFFAPQPAIWKFKFLHYRSKFQSAPKDFKFSVDLVHRVLRPTVKKSANPGGRFSR